MSIRRYRSPEEDSGRWDAFALRPGDVVVSTRSKHGTTWVQTIVLHLIHGVRLPAPLAELSPWLDHLVEPVEDFMARLDAQPHRWVVKTHTPLDGLPLVPEVHYVVVARHPLDAAVSLYHQGANIDRERLAELTGAKAPETARPSVEEWLGAWIEADGDSMGELDSLCGVFHHLCDAWARRDQANVTLLHFDDLLVDLDGQMRRLAEVLEITVEPGLWPAVVDAATFEQMRRRAGQLAPDRVGVLRDPEAFFRCGTSGEGRDLLDDATLHRYHERAAALAPGDLLDWLHRDPQGGAAQGS